MTVTDGSPARGERPGRLGLAGWMMFDWAAQPFFTVVTTFVFGPYFVSRIAENPAQVEKAKANPKLAGWFVGQVMKATGGKKGAAAIADWKDAHGAVIERVRSSLDDLLQSDLTVSKVAVAAGLFSDLARD